MITETKDTANNNLTVEIPNDPALHVRDNTTLVGESRKEAHRPKESLTNPKSTLSIGCWNVRTMYATGKTAKVAKEMSNYGIDILGISEARWTGFGRVQVNNNETVIFSGKENAHEAGVALMMSK